MSKKKDLLEKVKKLKKAHYECEDRWYSCPKSGSCADDSLDGSDCNCGTDMDNEKIDEIIGIIKADF